MTRGWLRALLVAVVSAGLLTPAAHAREPADPGIPPPPPPAAAELPSVAASQELSDLLEELQGFRQVRPRGDVALAVGDAAGNPLAATNATTPMLPASTMKLVTAAAALRVLGPDHRFVTRVRTTAAPDGDGVVDGDLVLVGGGDPVLATPLFARRVNSARPATTLRLLARRVARAGITRVTGDVVGDPSILADEPLAGGWTDRYLAGLDTSRSSGLTVDAGVRLFRRSGTLRAEAARDPAVRAARQFTDLLSDSGVTVAGTHGRRREAGAPGMEVARISSPPLHELLTHMLQTSDNHLADGIFRMLGATTGDPTWDGSAAAARRALDDAGIDWDGLRLADGSGLSRHNRLTADAIVRLLHTMANDPLRRPWLRMQARAGASGTMRRRLAGGPAEGRVVAKTGTLRDVRSLAGTVPGRDGRDHHFAVLANDLTAARDVAAARRLADVVALALVVAQDGCGPPVPVSDQTDARPPEAVICGTMRPE